MKLGTLLAVIACLGTPLITLSQEIEKSNASECWLITNVKGYSGLSSEDYEITKDGIPGKMLLCFIDDQTGSVSGTDTKLVRFGKSTLAGYASIGDLELFEVYQIDRENGKLLYCKSRVGTASEYAVLPDMVMSCIGDAAQVPLGFNQSD